MSDFEEKYGAVKMELPLQVYVHCEAWNAIRFSFAVGRTNMEIHVQLKEVFGETRVTRNSREVGKTIFTEERTDVHNLQRS